MDTPTIVLIIGIAAAIGAVLVTVLPDPLSED